MDKNDIAMKSVEALTNLPEINSKIPELTSVIKSYSRNISKDLINLDENARAMKITFERKQKKKPTLLQRHGLNSVGKPQSERKEMMRKMFLKKMSEKKLQLAEKEGSKVSKLQTKESSRANLGNISITESGNIIYTPETTALSRFAKKKRELITNLKNIDETLTVNSKEILDTSNSLTEHNEIMMKECDKYLKSLDKKMCINRYDDFLDQPIKLKKENFYKMLDRVISNIRSYNALAMQSESIERKEKKTVSVRKEEKRREYFQKKHSHLMRILEKGEAAVQRIERDI